MKAVKSIPKRGFVAVVTVLAMVLSIVAVSADRAEAVAPGSHGNGIVTEDSPVGWTPHVLDGYVRSFADLGNVIVAGGNFSEVTNPNGSIELDRDNVFAFEKGTGVIQSFSPSVNGEIYAVLPTGEPNMIWMVGGFSQVNGQSHSRIVKINVTNEQIDTSFDPPNFDGRIHDVVHRGDRLYVMGRFLNVGGEPHTLVAALDPGTGEVIPEVNIEFSVPRPNRPDGFLTIVSGDVTPDGSKMVVIGNFTVIDGEPRYQIGMLDLTTDPISVADWHTTDYDDSCASVFETYMRDVEISPDGEYFVVGTTGAFSGGWWFGTLCDTATRWDFSRTGNNLHPEWVNYTGGDTLLSTAVTESAIYLGGHQRWQNNPYSGDSVGPGAVDREGLAASDPRSGATISWDPGRDRGVGVYGFLATDEGLWIGSDTDRIARFQYRARIAFMPLSSGTTMPPDWTGELPGTVYSTGDGNSNELVRRDFNGNNVSLSQSSAGSIDLTNVTGAFMVDDKLYMGFDDDGDRTFEVMPFDGDFGPREIIDLNGLDTSPFGVNVANFENRDLPNMNGMFYDPVMGRLYFTSPQNGANPPRLSWRQFSPESNIVGAVRYDGPANMAGLNWDDVRSMFLVDDELYLATSNGNLTRWDWDAANGTPVTGTNVLVSGPGVDGEDWGANGAFLLVSGEPPNLSPTAIAEVSCVDGDCDFTGENSTDPDGTIEDYEWDFGDGNSDNGEMVSHSYAASGTYDASLIVTDDDGDTDTHEFEVDVTVPNQDPVAGFTADCDLLACDFDGSGSMDTDGNIVSWDWDFGDTNSDSGEMVSHTYAAAGTYTVSLTVTDNDGGTDTIEDDVTVFDTAGAAVVFHAANEASRNSVTPGVNIPVNSEVGDVVVLIATINNANVGVTGPPGWTLLDSDSNSGTQTHAWTKTVEAGEPGTQVEITLTERKKVNLHIAAYGNASGVSDFAVDVDSVNGTQRTTPTVTAATEGSALVSYWADKSSNNVTGWDLPAGVTERSEQIGPGGGRIASALGDTLGLSPGTEGGLTATTDSSDDRRGAAWSIIIAPAGPQDPVAGFTADCDLLACDFDGSGSMDPDGNIVSWDWDFGDTNSDSGEMVSHTYAAAGTYTVSLTVTDNDGGTDTIEDDVTVFDTGTTTVSFRASEAVHQNSATPSLDVPNNVQPGDVMVLIATINNNTIDVTGPAGWTFLATDSIGGTQTHAWTKVATGGDAASEVAITLSERKKTALSLVAYQNASAVSDFAVDVNSVSGIQRTTPLVDVAENGSALVSYWADKSSNNQTGWTLPGGVTEREQVVGNGGGRIAAAIADTEGMSSGAAGGLTATTDSTNDRRGAAWSIVIAPE